MSAVERLEKEFAQWLGAAGAVATGFGRGALWLALEAASTRGADVLVPGFICRQVVAAVERAGARPVFYRVKRELTITPEDLAAAWTGNTRAAILPHYFGRPTPRIRELASACRARGAASIEDCALAMGAGLEGELCGRFGDFAVFSFTKSDWCFGGGLVTASGAVHLAKLRGLQRERMKPAPRLCFSYGLLKWADHAANRPRWCRAATRLGRLLQTLSRIREDNFYDAGRFDVAMPNWAARRALRILGTLSSARARRQRAYTRILEVAGRKAPGAGPADSDDDLRLGSAEPKRRPLVRRHEMSQHLVPTGWNDARPVGRSEGSGASYAFMVLDAGSRAEQAIARADEFHVTLRPSWPGSAQENAPHPGAAGGDFRADLLILEISAELSEEELVRMGTCLSKCLPPAASE